MHESLLFISKPSLSHASRAPARNDRLLRLHTHLEVEKRKQSVETDKHLSSYWIPSSECLKLLLKMDRLLSFQERRSTFGSGASLSIRCLFLISS